MIINLESKLQEEYAYILSERIINAEQNKDIEEINSIRQLWDNESWNSILKKFNTEGSVWYVWWMDGVNNFIHTNL